MASTSPQAIEPGPLFGLHHAPPNANCPVGHGIQPALHEVYDDVEATVREQLGWTSIEDLLGKVLARQRSRDRT
jgi:hypothetical protein